MLSKNLIKANQFVLKEKEPILVDTNELVAQKIESHIPVFEEFKPEGFQFGLNAPEVDPLFVDMDYVPEEGETPMELVAQEAVYTGPSPEELIAQAQAEIEEMRIEAEKNISFLKKRSQEEGKQQGYEEGMQIAMQELDVAKQELEVAKQELEAKAKAMELEYQKLIDQLEPQFIKTITGIYEEVFKVELAGYKNILRHAITNTIRKVEGSKDFLVHVSRVDYEKMVEQKELLLNSISKQITVEFVEDATLKENECMIETNSGIFDCSIGVQLEELTKKLRLLSFEE